MDCDFVASTQEELLAQIGQALSTGGVSKKIAYERVQMMHLLKGLAATPVVQYPIRVCQTSDKVPDFQLTIGGRRVGAELTRFGPQDLEHGRALQEEGAKGTLSVSELFLMGTGRRRRQAVIRDGFGMKPLVFPISVEEEERIWIAGARKSLDAKAAVLAGNDFVHGDEDWLVLVDSVGEVLEEAEGRRDGFSRLLAGFWKPGWFSRVFLQDNFYRWQLMFTATDATTLCGAKE